MEHKLRIAVIGCGVVAQKHIKAAWHNRDRTELIALADINEDAMISLLKRSKFKNSYKRSIKLYKDHTSLLDKEKPDIVIITTPGGTHFSICMDALKSGSNVLVEKPMTLIPSEAEQLNNEAASRNLRIALGHIYRYFPLVEIIARDIRHGVFGRPLYGDVRVLWGHDQAYYDRSTWRGTWKQDGGVIMNQTIHAIDLMSYFLGGKAVRVCSMIAKQTHEMEAEDLGMAVISRDNGTYCTVTGTTSSDPRAKEAAFDIICTSGRIKAGILSGKPYFRITAPSKGHTKYRKLNFFYIRRFVSETIHRYGFIWLLYSGNPHSWILRDLADSIVSDKFPRADGLSGEESVRTVVALYNSAKEEKSVRLPLDPEQNRNIFTMDLSQP